MWTRTQHLKIQTKEKLRDETPIMMTSNQGEIIAGCNAQAGDNYVRAQEDKNVIEMLK